MKNLYKIFFLATLGMIAFSACVSKKKTVAPIKFEAPKIEPAPAELDSLIPFTRDLYNRLRANNQDIRKLQFFVDQTLVLSRGTDQSGIAIKDGKIFNEFGAAENRIELPAQTPGIVESIEPDGIRIKFESKPGNNIKFINNKYSPENFSFSGINWENGTAMIPYNNTYYRVSCGTCGSVADAKLVVRQKDVDRGTINSVVLPGVQVH